MLSGLLHLDHKYVEMNLPLPCLLSVILSEIYLKKCAEESIGRNREEVTEEIRKLNKGKRHNLSVSLNCSLIN
jgi:hypothetical protein